MKLKKGMIISVDNMEKLSDKVRRSRERDAYGVVYLEYPDNRGEFAALFTSSELNKLKQYQFPDIMTKDLALGRLYPFSFGTLEDERKVRKTQYIVKMCKDDDEFVAQLSHRLLSLVRRRALRHPGSIPGRTLLQ